MDINNTKLIYKKPLLWVISIVLVLLILFAAIFIVNPFGVKITSLKNEIDYDTILDDVDNIKASKGEVCYRISYKADIAEIIEQFKEIRVSGKPNVLEDVIFSESKNSISINDVSFCFSEGFDEFHAHKLNDISSSYPPIYEVKNPNEVKELFKLIENSESTRTNTNLVVENIKSGTIAKNITVNAKNLVYNIEEPYIELEIINQRDDNFEFGDDYLVYYETDGEWESCNTFKYIKNKRAQMGGLMLRILKPDSSIILPYYMYTNDLSKAGKYKIEFKYWWIEFELVTK